MNNLTKKQYENQVAQCNGLCNIDHDKIAINNPNLMPCVTCPFCKQLVDAILTPNTIICPSCRVEVSRGLK